MWWKKSKEVEKRPFLSAVIAAAGSSVRMGQDKLLLSLGGMPLLVRTLLTFERSALVDEIVIVCREKDIMPYAELCKSFGISKVSQLVRGGSTRAQSVRCGVLACADREGLVAIHDGARPLLRQEVLEGIIADAVRHGAAAPLVPMKDSVKKVKDGFIAGDVPRERIMAVQTPQIFARKDILRALQHAEDQGLNPTDDCAAAEQIGIRVFASRGDYANIKVTTEEDIPLAEALLQEMEE